MSVLLDHCTPRKFLRLLKEWGYAASLMTQHIRADSPDGDVIALAKSLDAVLLTVDLDFAHILDYPPSDYEGIIVMRYVPADEAEIAETLKQALIDLYPDGLRKTLVVVSKNRYRVRR